MAAFNATGYQSGTDTALAPSPGAVGGRGETPEVEGEYWTLQHCVDAYNAYLDSKRAEIEEQQVARRYRHAVQWTAEQIKTLNDRKQPVVTFNRLGRKIDGIVGLVEKLKQDPKAFPRTPEHQEGADLATAVLRYVMDNNQWKTINPIVAEMAAVDGYAGVMLDLKVSSQAQPQPGQPPDYDVMFEAVDNDGYFYDPRSFKHDFADARYLGMGKWVDQEMLIELMPESEDVIKASYNGGADLTSNSDRDQRWYQDNGKFKQVRLVEIWYKHKGGWCWAVFTRGAKLKEGPSPFIDNDGKQFCKFQMFSAQIDHDGDRYGFPRNLMSAQDEINQRRSKGLHELSNRRLRATRAAVADDDVEKIRREAARADGVILSNTSIDEIQFDDAAKQQALMGQLEFLKEAKAEIENFGPNPALLGNAGIAGNSGKAIALMQQAGIAELGPYMLNMRAWKLRLYRALFNTVQKYWTNERWIRVTDNQGLQQFVQLNSVQPHPDTGMPVITNAIGQLDVDIILDEGPDSITMMADTYEAISQALPSVAKVLSPPQAAAVMEVLIESSPLPADVKKKFRAAGQQQQPQGPPPEVQIKMAEVQAEQQRGEQQLQLQQRKMEMEAQTKQAVAAAEIKIKQDAAAAEVQVEQLRATTRMRLERELANSKMENERQMAAHQAEVARTRGATDNFATALDALSKSHKVSLEAKPPPAPPPPPPPPDHGPAILEALNHLRSQKRPTGVVRTPKGMQVTYD